MVRPLLLILLVLVFTSCESDFEETPVSTIETIRSVNWLPGDTLIAALVSKQTDGVSEGTNFRLYHRDGSIRREFFLTSYESAGGMHITRNGQTAIYNDDRNVELLDIASETSTIVSRNTTILSFDPDRDMCILLKTVDNPDPGAPRVFTIASVSGSSLKFHSTLETPIAQYDFPMFLSNGRIATLESDVTGNMTLSILDSFHIVKRLFNLPRGLFIFNPLAPRDTMSFFFATVTATASEIVTAVNRIRTDNGFIDEVQSIIGAPNFYYGDFYTVSYDGKKVICSDHMSGSSCVIKDIESGAETTIHGPEHIKRLYISNDNRSLAIIGVTAAGDKLSFLQLP